MNSNDYTCGCKCVCDFECNCDCNDIDEYKYCYNLHMNTFTIFYNLYHNSSINDYIDNQIRTFSNVMNMTNFIDKNDENRTNEYCKMIVRLTDYKKKYIELLTKSTGLPKDIIEYTLIDYCSPIDMYNQVINNDEYFTTFHNKKLNGLDNISNTYEMTTCEGKDYVIYRTDDLNNQIYGFDFEGELMYELEFERVDIYGHNVYKWFNGDKNYSFVGKVIDRCILLYDNNVKNLEFICK